MTETSLRERLLRRVRGHGLGHVFTPKDFLDLAERGSVGRALSELVEMGAIRRLGRGVYDYPKVNERLGIVVSPEPDWVASALARQTGSGVTPSGAVAANQLGLTTQVPAKLVYLTNGNDRQVTVGKQTYIFKRTTPKDFAAEQAPASIALRALKHLGKASVGEETIAHLREQLSPGDRRELVKRSAYMTDWLRSVARAVAHDEGSGHRG